MTYREFFSHVVDVVEALGATVLLLGGIGAFVRFVRNLVTHRASAGAARRKQEDAQAL